MKVTPRQVWWEGVKWDGTDEARGELESMLDALTDYRVSDSYLKREGWYSLRLWPKFNALNETSPEVDLGEWVVASSVGEVMVIDGAKFERMFVVG